MFPVMFMIAAADPAKSPAMSNGIAQETATVSSKAPNARQLKATQVLGSWVKVAGVFWSNPLHVHNFDCTFTFPGKVVETNGQILSGNRVRWA